VFDFQLFHLGFLPFLGLAAVLSIMVKTGPGIRRGGCFGGCLVSAVLAAWYALVMV
jgi:hypothetical protein